MVKSTVSIIVPVLDEAEDIVQTIDALPGSAEVIVVDGGSKDATLQLACGCGAVVIKTDRGRALQMNAGAAVASGDLLIFLHADTRLPPDVENHMREFEQSGRGWGRFDIRLSGAHPAFRFIEFLMNWRSRITGICTGDQAIFVRRGLFEAAGGYIAIPLMEDIALSRALKRASPPFCSDGRVVSSSRRWERDGIIRTVLLMWRLRLAYFLGANPQRLVRRYYGRGRWP